MMNFLRASGMGALVLAIGMAFLHPSAQTLSTTEQQVRDKVQHIPPQSKISVIPFVGQEKFGTLYSDDPESFTFYDVDAKRTETLRYADVKKVKRGYGGYNFATHRHVDQTTSWIFTIGFIAGLLALSVAAARS